MLLINNSGCGWSQDCLCSVRTATVYLVVVEAMAVLRAVFATSLFLFVCFASVNGDAICGLDNYDVSSLERYC